jgi:hypothetical protein
VADSRECAQCGALFVPSREHARFCSARCRVAWNRQNAGVPGTGDGVLGWSVTAMHDTTNRLLRARSQDRSAGYAMITEAVWWCTMVEATLVRYHPDARAAALARSDIAEHQSIEDTFAGLRFVRNRMGYTADPEDFLDPGPRRPGQSDGQVAAWTWKQIVGPGLSGLPGPAREWELARYQAYQAALADRCIGDTFCRAAGFLTETAEISQGRGRATARTPNA